MGMFDDVRLEPFMVERVREIAPRASVDGMQSKDGPCIMTELVLGETFSYTDFEYEWDPNVKSGLHILTGEMGGLVRVNERVVTGTGDFSITFFGDDYFTAYYRDGKFHNLILHPPFNP